MQIGLTACTHYLIIRLNFTSKLYFSISYFMNKIIFLVLFSISFILPLFAQHLTPIQETVIRKTMSAQFFDADKPRILNLGKDVFCVLGKDTLYNPDGYNYVFKLHHDTIERLDRSLYHGSNHRRFLFAHKGELFALGGYGFFTTNNNLQVFNLNVKEWLFKPTTGDVPDFINGLSFKIGDDIYNMYNFKSGNNTAPNLFDSSIYKLDLKTMVWQRFYQPDYLKPSYMIVFHADDYSLLLSEVNTIIVKPSEFKFLQLDNDFFGLPLATSIDSISHNVMFFTANGNTNINVQKYNLDLNATWKNNSDKIKSFNLKPFEQVKTSNRINYWFFISIALMVVIFIGYFLKKQPRAKPNETIKDSVTADIYRETPIQTETATESLNYTQTVIEEDLSDSLYMILLKSEKTFLSSDELDELLGISHLEPDSKKSKRHRFLVELNVNHPGFITKSKDQSDKRRFIYKIVK